MIPGVWFMWKRPKKMHNLNERKKYKKLSLGKYIDWDAAGLGERREGMTESRCVLLRIYDYSQRRVACPPGLAQRSGD